MIFVTNYSQVTIFAGAELKAAKWLLTLNSNKKFFMVIQMLVWCMFACSVSLTFRCDMQIVILITSLIQADLASWNKPKM